MSGTLQAHGHAASGGAPDCLIVALDGMHREAALALAQTLAGRVWGFKVNDLLVEWGVEMVRALKPHGQVFADAKLHDIPNTVENGVRRLQAAGADLITVHASGGAAMLKAACAVAGQARILAVTVLTALGQDDALALFGRPPHRAVLDFARMAQASGVSGIVCAAQELELVGQDQSLAALLKVVPGIRPRWHGVADDQKRVMTPGAARGAGADFLVVGRPITHYHDPLQAVGAIDAELRGE